MGEEKIWKIKNKNSEYKNKISLSTLSDFPLSLCQALLAFLDNIEF